MKSKNNEEKQKDTITINKNSEVLNEYLGLNLLNKQRCCIQKCKRCPDGYPSQLRKIYKMGK